MYVAVKGGERAIREAHALLADMRRGDTVIAELTLEQIQNQMSLAVDRVMNEGSLFDPELAALAIKQAQGDMIEAIFLLRAYRTTLPRHGETVPLETCQMRILRRISAVFKDVPGGQLLGPTYDYTHRLLDFSLAVAEMDREPQDDSLEEHAHEHVFEKESEASDEMARVLTILENDALVELPPEGEELTGDITREPLDIPADRPTRYLQIED